MQIDLNNANNEHHKRIRQNKIKQQQKQRYDHHDPPRSQSRTNNRPLQNHSHRYEKNSLSMHTKTLVNA